MPTLLQRLSVDDVSSKDNLTLTEARRLYEKYIYGCFDPNEKRSLSVQVRRLLFVTCIFMQSILKLLSLQIIGKHDKEYSMEHDEYGPESRGNSSAGKKYRKSSKIEQPKIDCHIPLVVLTPPEKLRRPGVNYVENIHNFKRILESYPTQWPLSDDDESSESD
jgi:hypothetical protein